MTPATVTELPEEQRLFKVSWELLKKYRHIRQPEGESWTELVTELETLSRIGEGTPCADLARGIAVALAAYLEASSKEEPRACS